MSSSPTPATTQTAAALEVRGLTVSYRSAPVLWEVECRFPAGHLSAIVGPNGAGRSTLLKAALGLVPADAGRVLIDGVEGSAALDRVAYVPQAESVDWDFPITVREVVEMGRYRSTGWFRRVGRADRAIAAECLERVGMASFGRRQIGQLSGGQRQRVFLARALAQQAASTPAPRPTSSRCSASCATRAARSSSCTTTWPRCGRRSTGRCCSTCARSAAAPRRRCSPRKPCGRRTERT
jgi:manganese/zinc/iron transport system ATP- binding protein